MTKVRPFSCGTQMLDWTASNCERCVKHDLATNSKCEIDKAITSLIAAMKLFLKTLRNGWDTLTAIPALMCGNARKSNGLRNG